MQPRDSAELWEIARAAVLLWREGAPLSLAVLAFFRRRLFYTLRRKARESGLAIDSDLRSDAWLQLLSLLKRRPISESSFAIHFTRLKHQAVAAAIKNFRSPAPASHRLAWSVARRFSTQVPTDPTAGLEDAISLAADEIAKLSPRERRIVVGRLWNTRDLDSLAVEFRIHRERVRQIYNRAIQRAGDGVYKRVGPAVFNPISRRVARGVRNRWKRVLLGFDRYGRPIYERVPDD